LTASLPLPPLVITGESLPVIDELDAALEAFIRHEVLDGTRVEIHFDAPTRDWVARRAAPTIDLYLYDIREDLQRRQAALERVRDPASRTVREHRLPPRRFRLSYLLTAWTQRPEDEHRLLAACLAAFCRHEILPAQFMTGGLAAAAYPVYLEVALPPAEDRSIADVWSALGGELKPSLDVVAIAPLDPTLRLAAAKPVLEEPWVTVDGAAVLEGGREGQPSPRRGSRRGGRGVAPVGSEPPSTGPRETVRGGAPPRHWPRGEGREAAPSGGSEPGAGREGAGEAPAAGGEVPPSWPGPDPASLGGGRVLRVRGLGRP
jgi:hypothetical protein